MGNQHHSDVPGPINNQAAPAFLGVRPGQYVVVQDIAAADQEESKNWWMGQVVFCKGGARDPQAISLFQIADVDDGEIRWVNADQVSHVLWGMDGLAA